MWHYLQLSVSNTNILIRSTNSSFISQCRTSNHGLLFLYISICKALTILQIYVNDTLVSDPQNHNRKRKTTCTILILRIALNGSVGILMKMVVCVMSLMNYPDPLLEFSCKNPKFYAVEPHKVKLLTSFNACLESKKIMPEWNRRKQGGWFDWAMSRLCPGFGRSPDEVST